MSSYCFTTPKSAEQMSEAFTFGQEGCDKEKRRQREEENRKKGDGEKLRS